MIFATISTVMPREGGASIAAYRVNHNRLGVLDRPVLMRNRA